MNINDFAFGIDISHWNASADGKQLVNFDVIAAHKPTVCFIAAKASESNWYKDDRFDYHWAEMRRIGVGRIAYHFMRFDVSGESQADKLLSVTQDWDWEHDRLCLDCEAEGSQTAAQVTDIVNACLERLKNITGRYPIVYSRKEWVDRKLQVNRMPKVDWWLAAYLKTLPKPLYTPEMTPPPPLPRGVSTWLIHQTTSRGKSIGAPSYYMDYDRWNGSEEDVKAYFGYAEQPEPPTPPEPPEQPSDDFPKVGIVIADPSVNIRKEPNIQSADIGDFVKGANLNIIGEQDDFWKVSAWVAKQWVQVNEPYQPPEGVMAIPPLSQKDPGWANDKMGNSTCTIDRFGCLITSITMALRWFGKDIDVKEFNQWLSTNGGYVSGTGNLYWGAIPKLYPDIYMHTAINCISVPASLDKIDALLAQDIPVIVEVDFNPATNPIDQHWVLIIGKQGDNYIVNDPWYGDTSIFKQRYGSPSRYIFWIRAYAKRG